MEEKRRPRERELVLSPNEYAYVLDSTKGHINCYVGPNKTSLAQTDELVVFNALTKRFDRVSEMIQAVQLFATAPAGWYLVLKNPSHDEKNPKPGMASPSAELDIGRKVIVEGPASFPLWPGQMVRVIQGHRLRSNQYLVVRAYDAVAANETAPEGAKKWEQGEQRIIRGTETSFYMPATGIEVVASKTKAFVRDAVTLQRLEYCVLIGEDGTKTYVRGEAVVFPSPHQRFLVQRDQRRFRAIELSETTGLYVKVIAPYAATDEETGEERAYREGEELFLTGENKVYFPREEHAIIRHGENDRHHAVAIPRGEGRYVLNRKTGEVTLCSGPRMFLPDPRREVLVRRVLSPAEERLLYPGRAQACNAGDSVLFDDVVAVPPPVVGVPGAPGDRFERGAFVAPRTITLNDEEGAVNIDVWTGYAVQLKSKSGARRVVQGPASALLQYDETVDTLTLSTGTPKSTSRLLRTAYLQLCGNKVSDAVDVHTRDLVRARVTLKYRVNFEGDDPSRWFMIDNYVQLLCDHASSKVKAAARKRTIAELRREITDLVRDALLGAKNETSTRAGLVFEENAMRVYDVEVLDLSVLDKNVADLLAAAQFQSVGQSVKVAQKESLMSAHQRTEEIERLLAAERQRTELLRLQLAEEKATEQHQHEEVAQRRLSELQELERTRELRDAELYNEIRKRRVETEIAAHEAQLRRQTDAQTLELQRLQAEVDGAVKQAEAFSPQLVSALHRLGDETMISALTENFSELAAVEGRGVLETARKFLDFVPATLTPQLQSGRNGVSHSAASPTVAALDEQ